MKACSQVACLVLVFGVLLAGCSGTATTPQDVATVVVPSATVTSLPPSATLAPSATQLPSATLPPPISTLPSPTQTPLATVAPATDAPATPAGSPVPTLGNLPVEGLWHGGGNNLLIDFLISMSDGKANVTDVGILWEGRGECELNARYDVLVPVDENGFTMTYYTDDISFVLTGNIVSSQVIEGVLDMKYKGCGDHQVSWRAVPKSGISQRP